MISYPPSVARILGSSVYRPEETGKSGARVLVFDDYVLKIRPAGGPDTADTQVLRWLSGRLAWSRRRGAESAGCRFRG